MTVDDDECMDDRKKTNTDARWINDGGMMMVDQ